MEWNTNSSQVDLFSGFSLKARRFSRQHNRNVRSEGQEAEEEEEDCVPSPLHTLLAHRDLWFTSSKNHWTRWILNLHQFTGA